MQKLLPNADASVAEGDFIYSSGLNTFNNMRYYFTKAIKLAMTSYKTCHARYNESLIMLMLANFIMLILLSSFIYTK